MTLNVNVNHTVLFDVSPSLRAFFKELFVAAFDELKGEIGDVKTALDAQKDQILAVISAEHDQVAAAIASLEAKIGETVSPEQLADLKGDLQALKTAAAGTAIQDAVSGIFVPAPEAPTP